MEGHPRVRSLAPDFVSVTYGASGFYPGNGPFGRLRRSRSTTLRAVAHLTLQASRVSRSGESSVRTRRPESGTYLAIRGDMPGSHGCPGCGIPMA